jgi:hypothetical protein
MDSLVGRHVGAADLGVKSVEVFLEQAGVQFHFKIAAGADRSEVGHAHLA